MTTITTGEERVRVQVDLTQVEVSLLEVLQRRLSVRSRADLLQQAFGAFLWLAGEMLAGRRVVSVAPDDLADLPRYKELCIPSVAPAQFNRFEHLIVRPETGRSQPYLKGRNMTVGQLVYRLRAESMTPEAGAEDMDLPLSQVREAFAYYNVHRDQVDGEMAEEARFIRDQGIPVEPADAVPG